MLFLLKRTWSGAALGLLGLTALALLLRQVVPAPLPLALSTEDVLHGLLVIGLVLLSDGAIHGLLLLTFRQRYAERHRELAAVFRGQTLWAILCGALMAGVGEELLFRSLDAGLGYLLGSAVVFGLLHHIRRELWPFTLWAIWQGLLFAAALYYFRRLGVTATAHFLHDLLGFLVFRYWYNRPSGDTPT